MRLRTKILFSILRDFKIMKEVVCLALWQGDVKDSLRTDSTHKYDRYEIPTDEGLW